ncbi:glutathione peroxidase [Aneurinibacillus migulanus]|uniref:Glutathione peroxidase n=1 Tax=Aneurinibacillus migulanus TaxID=47500 RepID=A0A0D1XX65_ANEMI|nr:glutathione peroxidase [Aneurinibacillus migulanus]KIV58811.1 glutathione peroxidase [Aneurinibacillus migulanus]KON96504.1 glutathione peroxidase [Aneurinibacillus migulanus]MED0892471.1 glutathione peroxidase [Aneurinibacillus migulanus]MED1615576.1 glutathione peroxidase [Aneurinibacillus migulanus]SDI18080.1 glutathione peroxidase [Aneurinibacillus migulanus]
MSIYDFTVKNIRGEEVKLEQYKNKVVMIVNTASKCRFTTQYSDLQSLYERYHPNGFEVLAFPCNQFAEQEPESNEQIQTFCQLNYAIKFPMFEKINVRGLRAHPLFTYLTEQAPFKGFDSTHISAKILHTFLQEKFPELLIGDSIKWNFTKFLIDRSGKVINRFESPVDPIDIETSIEALL